MAVSNNPFHLGFKFSNLLKEGYAALLSVV
jgi:hypothetical protein